ncbi:MAG: ABC transporter permease [Gallicola sp.]|nr:ABC transporter permease [Gallicola sp.]
MKFLILLRSSFQDVKRNKKRTLLTMLGIIIGIAAVITIVALGRGFEKFTLNQLTPKNQEGIEAPIHFNFTSPVNVSDNTDYFTQENLNYIRNLPGIKAVKAEAMEMFDQGAEVSIQNHKGKTISLNAESVDATSGKIIEGRGILPEDGEGKKRVCVIDEKTKKDAFKGRDPMGKAVKVNNLNYVIIGVKETFDSSDPDNMFAMTGSAEVEVPSLTLASYQKAKKALQNITLVLEKGADFDETTKLAIDYLNQKGKYRAAGEYQTFNIQDQLKQISKVLSTITIFISMVAAISLLIAGIGMMNMMYISVSERTKEIGIRRALGATKKEIQLQFMLEGMIITVIGGLIGYIFGLIISILVSNILKFPVFFDIVPILISLGVSMFIGIFFSWSPAQAAARKNVIDIL